MKRKEPNYRGLFLVGISMIALGTAFISTGPKSIGPVFIAVGGLFMIISIRNKDKWRKD